MSKRHTEGGTWGYAAEARELEGFDGLLDDLTVEWDKESKFDLTTTQMMIIEECDRIKGMLLEKNRKYGDSAIHPVRCFSKASPIEQINIRLDDKISRLMSGQADEDEDVEDDLMGYLVLKKVAKRCAK